MRTKPAAGPVLTELCPGANYTKPVTPADDLESVFCLDCLTLQDVKELAAGIVPIAVQVAAMRLLDFEQAVLRNADRPVAKKKRGVA